MLGFQVQPIEHQLELVDLRVHQRFVGGDEHARRVGHGVVQPHFVELVAEVVVVLDVLARAGLAVGLELVPQPGGEAPDRILLERAFVVRLVEVHHLQHAGEVGRVPAAIEIGLAKADLTVLQHMANHCAVVNVEHAVQVGTFDAAKAILRAVGPGDIERAHAHAAQHVAQHAQAQGHGGVGPQCVGQCGGKAITGQPRGRAVGRGTIIFHQLLSWFGGEGLGW